MANLVKIQKIHLYVGFTEHAQHCYEAIELLKSKKIPYTLLNYSDQDQAHKENFEALSTWEFGNDETKYKKQFDQYPILIWEECYDDWHVEKHTALDLEDLKTKIDYIRHSI